MPRAPFLSWLPLAAGVALWAPAAQAEDCPAIPQPGAASGSPDALYAAGIEAMKSKRYAEAVPLFASLALDDASHPQAEKALMLSLDAYHLTGAQCLAGMADLTERYRQQYCNGTATPSSEDTCKRLHLVAVRIAHGRADAILATATGATGDRARNLYRQAGEAYLTLFEQEHAAACKEKSPEQCQNAEEILFNAAHAFTRAGVFEQAKAARELLFDPQYHLQETALAKQALFAQGRADFALFDYESAASYYERFATQAPKEADASEALLDAVLIRLALLDDVRAQKDADLWEKYYASKRGSDHAKLVLAIAQLLAEDPASAAELERYLKPRMGIFVKSLVDQLPVAQQLLGTALWRQKKTQAATSAFEQAANFQLPEAQTRSIDPQGMRFLGQTLTAMGHARLWLADRLRDEADKLTVKKGDDASLQKKAAAVRAAEKMYILVLELQPVPPPLPTILAAARVARMYGQLWAQSFLAFGETASLPLLAITKAANRRCVDLGAKFQVASPEATACASWLARHYPREFASLSEIAPRANWLQSSTLPAPRPLEEP